MSHQPMIPLGGFSTKQTVAELPLPKRQWWDYSVVRSEGIARMFPDWGLQLDTSIARNKTVFTTADRSCVVVAVAGQPAQGGRIFCGLRTWLFPMVRSASTAYLLMCPVLSDMRARYFALPLSVGYTLIKNGEPCPQLAPRVADRFLTYCSGLYESDVQFKMDILPPNRKDYPIWALDVRDGNNICLKPFSTPPLRPTKNRDDNVDAYATEAERAVTGVIRRLAGEHRIAALPDLDGFDLVPRWRSDLPIRHSGDK